MLHLQANLSSSEGERPRLGIPSLSIVSRLGHENIVLILVGEFGESEYLRRRLREEVMAYDGRKIPILQPPNA